MVGEEILIRQEILVGDKILVSDLSDFVLFFELNTSGVIS